MKYKQSDPLFLKIIKVAIVYCQLYSHMRRENKAHEKEMRMWRIRIRAEERAGVYAVARAWKNRRPAKELKIFLSNKKAPHGALVLRLSQIYPGLKR